MKWYSDDGMESPDGKYCSDYEKHHQRPDRRDPPTCKHSSKYLFLKISNRGCRYRLPSLDCVFVQVLNVFVAIWAFLQLIFLLIFIPNFENFIWKLYLNRLFAYSDGNKLQCEIYQFSLGFYQVSGRDAIRECGRCVAPSISLIYSLFSRSLLPLLPWSSSSLLSKQ